MTDGDNEGRRKRVDISASQLIGGGVATMAAATAASFLGVYGTVIGAAVMSVISTAGTAVVAHWMQQGGAKARGLAVRGSGRSAGEESARESLARSGPGAADGDTLLAAASDDTPSDSGQRPWAEETRALPLAGAGRGAGAADADPAAGEDPAAGRRWLTWRRLAVPAAAVFVAVMAAILVFELFTGQSLSDTVQGREDPSAPTLLGGGSMDGQGGADPAPESTPTAGTGEEGGSPAAPSGGVERQQEQPTAPAPAEPQPGGEEDTGEETSVPEEDTGETGGTDEQAPGTGGDAPAGRGGVEQAPASP
ncbi:hypothetical protein FZ103_20635 [Streptomonospora sp. PA3]|uniref:hypothetical protein n=1 Tax=Streptomonospora sp. PA3 TaxID=2607326 RepID=UPI0012DDB1B5|nr:hypothetical protein [Streptomonospora sp. PA3]MUL43548.1 hypothetical protein [Streptomonospora sp. PA3]